jgi:methylglutaconyl-CoA hydratase
MPVRRTPVSRSRTASSAKAAKTKKAAKGASTSAAARRRAKRVTVRADDAPYTGIAIELRGPVALLALNRPEVHNAFDDVVIAELTDALLALDAEPDVRAIVLLGAGRSFCAGADLTWMRRMATFGKAQNLADARGLARLLATLANVGKPTVARVHGSVFGGGVGLVACCDIAIADVDATFALSEAKLGLIPATIAPYVVEAIGARHARRFMLTAERFTAADAYRIGLVHDIVPMPELDARVNDVLGALMLAGPVAQREVKTLVTSVANRPIDAGLADSTARHIAAVRASPEGREGVAAFLGKRPPAWVPPSPASDEASA